MPQPNGRQRFNRRSGFAINVVIFAVAIIAAASTLTVSIYYAYDQLIRKERAESKQERLNTGQVYV